MSSPGSDLQDLILGRVKPRSLVVHAADLGPLKSFNFNTNYRAGYSACKIQITKK